MGYSRYCLDSSKTYTDKIGCTTSTMGAGQSEPQGVGPEQDGRGGKIRGSKFYFTSFSSASMNIIIIIIILLP